VLRRYLYLTAATTGAAIMIVEILGAKMLSPYVGLSHFVWTAQIAVTLVALACGYYFGGRLVDRLWARDHYHSRDLDWLYWSILSAAVYLALTVLICQPVAYWCLDFNLAVGSLLASMVLFFVPLALLAMTGPFLVRVITSSVSAVGGSVGRLTAISTLGSFAGTILVSYVMIPHLPNSLTMYLTAMALLLICTGYFGVFRRRFIPLALILVIAVAGGFAGARIWWATRSEEVVELFKGNSNFGQLEVLDRKDGSLRFYLNDLLTQNTFDPMAKKSHSQFTYLLAGLARCYTTNVNDVLCIGLGVGIVPMDFARHGARVDVVEINPAVVPVGAKFFDLDTNLIHLTIDDGRHFLNKCAKQYDAVILDAFLGDSSPSHLLTKEAFSSMHRVLRPGGVLVINAFGDLEPGRDFFAASVKKSLSAAFRSVRIHSNDDGALFYVATDRTPANFIHQPSFQGMHPDVVPRARETYAGIVDTMPEDGRVLTDDFNPVEYYDAKNREELRKRLVKYTMNW
jgi:spermidine synthase